MLAAWGAGDERRWNAGELESKFNPNTLGKQRAS